MPSPKATAVDPESYDTFENAGVVDQSTAEPTSFSQLPPTNELDALKLELAKRKRGGRRGKSGKSKSKSKKSKKN